MAKARWENDSHVEAVEAVLSGEDNLRLDPEWRAKNKVLADRYPKDERPTTYRHIISGNSTYGFVPPVGPVQLELNFVPISSGREGGTIHSAIRTYTNLVAKLSAEGIPHQLDEALEDAICDAAEALEPGMRLTQKQRNVRPGAVAR